MRKIVSRKFILLVLIIVLAGFLRFFKLAEYPVQLNHDEVSQIYDTSSIVKTGKDIYGNFLPLAFPSTGEYKVGHYIYISTIPYLFFGDKEFTIRIPAAFFGTVTILAVFLFIFALTKNWDISLLSAIAIAVTPSEIFYSRKSFEGEIGLCLIFLGLFCLVNTLNNLKSNIWGYGTAVFLASAMYAYTAYTILVPLMVLMMAIIFKKQIKMEVKKYLLIFSVWFILIIPLIFMTLTDSNLRFRAASVFITQDINLGRQLELSQNSAKTYIDYIFTHFLNQFNPAYIFAKGLDLTNQDLIGMGPLYAVQLPLFLLGTIFIIRMRNFSNAKKILFGIVILSMVPSAFTFEPFSPHRSMPSFATLSIISAFGLYWLGRLSRWMLILMGGVLILNFIYFIQMYTVNFPYEKSQHMHYPFKEVALFAISQKENFDQIIIDPTYGQSAPVYGVATHYYLAYFGKYPPAQLHKDLKITDNEMSFDKFSIRKIDWSKDQNLKNTLIVASPWQLPIDIDNKNKVVKTFSFYDGKLAFYAIKL